MNSVDRNAVRAVWAKLAADRSPDDGIVKLLIPVVQACRVYAGRNMADGLEALILDLENVDAGSIGRPPAGSGFEIVTESSGGIVTRITLKLVEKDYRDLFVHLSEDIVWHLSQARNGAECSAAMIERMSRWQAFLRRRGARGLPRERRIGLAGELLFLRDVLLPRVQPGRAVAAWTGPDGGAHDWEFDGGGLEIKSTTASEPSSVQIANASQLDAERLPHLFLVILHLALGPAAGETLPEIVESARALIPGGAQLAFDEKIISCGYSSSDAPRYTEEKYSCREIVFYEVSEGFPRLLCRDLPDGVVGVRYDLAIPALVPYARDAEGVYTVILESGGLQ
jgi:hypothetical protein